MPEITETLRGLEAEASSKPSGRTPRILPEKFLFSLPDAAAALSISTTHLLKLIKHNRIGTRRLGARILIFREDIVRLMAKDRPEPRR